MEFKDYYTVLGLDKKASNDEIKRAYRKLAREYHPDVRPNDAEAEKRFKEISEAYAVLSDPEKKRKYDMLGSSYRNYERTGRPGSEFNWQEWTGGRQSGEGGQFFGDLGSFFSEGVGGFSDFFTNIFGGASSGAATRSARENKARDYQATLEISLQEAYTGCTRTVAIAGKKIKLNLKPGIADGQKLKLSGKATPGANGLAPGDVYVTISIARHPQFERDGKDLHTKVPVSLYTALLGGAVELETFGGKVSLRVPPECENGTKMRLKGLGMPDYTKPNTKGDLYAEISISIPRNLSAKEKKLIKELADMRGGS